eukprot:gnl/Chilomastix_caulleri/1956.p3 GENE.gnl/Chilomastix_caulleri/1956~~gnl/Chilomastix_caulleri/1956.p3  ORF type:complete len:106 (+),score=15.36 gnl/Chilomastix_caulleri/1956:773-1090(+)
MSEYSKRVNVAADKVARSRGSAFNYENMAETARLYTQRNNMIRTDKYTTTKQFYHDNAPHLLLQSTTPFTLKTGRYLNASRSPSAPPIKTMAKVERPQVAVGEQD